MITREKLEEILDDDSKNPFQEKEVDHKMKALTLLREIKFLMKFVKE